MRAAGAEAGLAAAARRALTGPKPALFGHLGDQDVWNYYLIERPAAAHRLPCGWNAQLRGGPASPPECRPFKIVHGTGKAFGPALVRSRGPDDVVTATARKGNALGAFQRFWRVAPRSLDHLYFEPGPLHEHAGVPVQLRP